MPAFQALIRASFLSVLVASSGCGGPEATAAPRVASAADSAPKASSTSGSADEGREPDPTGDIDGDGIANAMDACTLQAEDKDGYLDADGCPEPDNDGDGVPDELDRGPSSCANDPEDFDGFEDNDGCPDPDNDRDTTLDINDMCPMNPGMPVGDKPGCLRSNERCFLPACGGSVDTVLPHVQFEVGDFKVPPLTLPLIDAVVYVLTVSRETRIEIQGHTDGRESEGEVKRLGELRAEEVKRHLVRRGIDASRLNTCGYGGERPIAPPWVDAESRRKINRRVQFVVITNEPACAAPTPPWPPGTTR